MKQYLLFILVFSFNYIHSMELENKSDIYQQFRVAIIDGDKEQVKNFLKAPVDLCVHLDKKGSNALDVALENSDTDMMNFIVKKISSKIDKAELCLWRPFQIIGKTGEVTHLNKLMS